MVSWALWRREKCHPRVCEIQHFLSPQEDWDTKSQGLSSNRIAPRLWHHFGILIKKWLDQHLDYLIGGRPNTAVIWVLDTQHLDSIEYWMAKFKNGIVNWLGGTQLTRKQSDPSFGYFRPKKDIYLFSPTGIWTIVPYNQKPIFNQWTMLTLRN